MKNYLINVKVLIGLFALIFHFQTNAQCPNIIWADDFNGTSLDLSKWSYQIGDGCSESICGWGNQELQSYQEANVTVNGGQLHITAKKERIRGAQYTSGRIRSLNKGDWTYGRFEASIKLPSGNGLWPAFWMLPTDQVYGNWPASGEIDIMEFISSSPNETLGTIHYGANGHQYQGSTFNLLNGLFTDTFHEFAIEWEPNEIRWFVDGQLFLTKTNLDVAPDNWPFDQRFHMLLNVAVGGNLGGAVDNNIFPATMDVEYVRVFDGFKAYMAGNRYVENGAIGEVYSVGNISGGTSVNWTVPAGATIVSGQNSSSITVNWGTAGGNVVATFNTACGSNALTMGVDMAPVYVKNFSFENFDQPAVMTLNSTDGTLTEVATPSPNTVNSSALCGRYVRNSSAQYDAITYGTSAVSNAGAYVNGDLRYYIDVYTSAPIGTPIIIQLESSTALPSNYPSGRHSRYFAYTKARNAWHRIFFSFEDRPDGSVADNNVSSLLVLFNSNTFTGDTYYFDNLDSYQIDTGGGSNVAPTVSITAPTNGAVLNQGSNVAITANAADSDGTVSNVEFFVNGSSIGTDTSSPYSISWTVGLGSFALTAVATDNGGASTTSTTVNVTGQASGPATDMHVASIVTSTQNAGQGKKNGTATITIIDNNGNPVSNATVTGTFSGTFTETKMGTTSSNGSVTLVTSGSAKGTVQVDLCVANVTHATLAYNSSQNVITCTGTSGARMEGSSQALSITESSGIEEEISVYPNPFTSSFLIALKVDNDKPFFAKIYTMDGKVISRLERDVLETGYHKINVNLTDQKPGIYFLSMSIGDKTKVYELVKN